MAQQTAVEWLVNELIFKGEYEYLPNSYFLMSDKDIDKIIIQAKAMEKENMYQVWKTSEEWSDGKLLDSKKSFEEYYNETYNK